MTATAPTVLRIGWRRTWIPPHLRRRLFAALLAGVGVLLALSSLHPSAGQARVVVAAHDLAAGARLSAGDLTVVSLPAAATPAGTHASLPALVGRVLAAPVQAREPVNDLRLSGREGGSGLAPGLVAAPVRLADADVAPLLHPGDRVDVLAARSTDDAGDPAATTRAAIVASDVQVLSVATGGSGTSGPAAQANTSGGALVVLAVTRGVAQSLAGEEAGGRLSVTLLSS